MMKKNTCSQVLAPNAPVPMQLKRKDVTAASTLPPLGGVEQVLHAALLRSLSDMGEGLMVIEDKRFSFVNDALCQLAGYTSDELLLWPAFLPLFHADEANRILINHEQRLTGKKFLTCYETAIQHKCGRRIAVDISVAVLETAERKGVVVTVRDITERKRTQEALFQEKELAQITLRSIGDGVITTNTLACVTYLNPVAEQLTGWSSANAYGQPIERVFRIFNEMTGEPVANPVVRALHGNCPVALENNTELLSRDGKRYPIDDSCAPIRTKDGGTAGAVLIFRDVTAARATVNRISYQAKHDALTGLVNRQEFERIVSALCDEVKINCQRHALLYLDFDKFKAVNDTCGHFVGDELLRLLSQRLQNKMRKSDVLARLGGDEFGCLLVGCSFGHAQLIAQSLVDAIREFPFTWQGQHLSVGLSIGLIEIAEESRDVRALLNAADAACYAAKRNGRNRVYCGTR